MYNVDRPILQKDCPLLLGHVGTIDLLRSTPTSFPTKRPDLDDLLRRPAAVGDGRPRAARLGVAQPRLPRSCAQLCRQGTAKPRSSGASEDASATTVSSRRSSRSSPPFSPSSVVLSGFRVS